MFRIFVLAAFLVCIGLSGVALAQDADRRTKDLAAALDKTKYKKKDKGLVSVELFLDIRNEPAAKVNAAEYSGVYEADGYRLDLSAATGGSASGTGSDSFADGKGQVNFTLRDGRIEGALLTATKVYDNGDSVPLEAVFVNRTVRAGKTAVDSATKETSFGVAFIQNEKPEIAACDPAKSDVAIANATTKDRKSLGDTNENTGWAKRVFLQRR